MMPSVASTDLYPRMQTGEITKAQYDMSKRYALRSSFLTREGKLALVTADAKVVVLRRDGKVWVEYAYHGKIKQRKFG